MKDTVYQHRYKLHAYYLCRLSGVPITTIASGPRQFSDDDGDELQQIQWHAQGQQGREFLVLTLFETVRPDDFALDSANFEANSNCWQ